MASYLQLMRMAAANRGWKFDVVNSTSIAGVVSTLTGETITVHWGDGTNNTYSGTDQAYSHNYGSAGNRVVTVTNHNALTELTMTTAGACLSFTLASMPRSMIYLALYGTSSTITGALSDLPSGMTTLALGSTSSTITGALSDLPSGMIYLALYGTSSTITGALSDLPSGMTTLALGSTSSTITGGGSVVAAKGIREIYIQNTSLSQANVDSVLLRLYTDRTLFTYATPVLNIGGTNDDPSGTYQDADPPTTGNEYRYELVNDPETEGFNKWAITV